MKTIGMNLATLSASFFSIVATGFLGFHIATGLVAPIL